MLGVELAHRESASSWKDFLLGLKQRGLRGVVCVISDDHAGLRQAMYVTRLRKKIETDAENPKLIKAVRGIGYVFDPSAE